MDALKYIHRVLALALLLGGGSAAAATHAPANSTIDNTADVTYTVGTSTTTTSSNTDTITVDELVDVAVTRQSASPIGVLTPQANAAILFRVTNLGNGTETYDVTGSITLGGDDFDPTNLEFYLDDGDGLFEPGGDDGAPITDATIGGELFEDLWLVSDIPAARPDGDLADVELTATSSHGTGVAGSAQAGNGDGGVDLVFGTSTGTDTDAGAYEVQDIAFTVVKSSVVDDQFGGNEPIPGATITYTISVTTAGTGTATGVNVTDAIPTNTTYVGASTTYNTVGQSDVADGDNCDADDTVVGSVFCAVGTVTGATTTTVTFQVTID